VAILWHSKPALSSPTPAWREATCLWQYPPSALKLCRSLAPPMFPVPGPPMTSAGCHDLFLKLSPTHLATLSHQVHPILPSHAPQPAPIGPNMSDMPMSPLITSQIGARTFVSMHPYSPGIWATGPRSLPSYDDCETTHCEHYPHPITRVPFQGHYQ